MRKFIDTGQRVKVISSEQINLCKYVNTIGWVTGVRLNCVPTSAVVQLEDGVEGIFYMRDLEVVPPEDSIIQHGDAVRISKSYRKTRHHIYNPDLLKKVGTVRGFDYRDSSYYVDCGVYGGGWFPLQSLTPLDYRGDDFFYPNDLVIYDDRECVVQKVQKSKNNLGQLLYIEGEWIPSTSVLRVGGKS